MYSCIWSSVGDGETSYEYVKEVNEMLRWILIFLVLALVAAALGFGGIAGAAADIARILFWVFIILFILGLIFGRGRTF
jgi:uncharacterized membrane protein YtjA (UPF0391 family)